MFVAMVQMYLFNVIFGSELIQSLNNLIEDKIDINDNWIVCDRSQI